MVRSMRNIKESSLYVLIVTVLSISLGAVSNGVTFQNSLSASTEGGGGGGKKKLFSREMKVVGIL
jgi:hypothetical protein